MEVGGGKRGGLQGWSWGGWAGGTVIEGRSVTACSREGKIPSTSCMSGSVSSAP